MALDPCGQFQVPPRREHFGPPALKKITKRAEFISYSAVRYANILTIYLPEGKTGPSSSIPNLVSLFMGNPVGPSPRGREPGPANPGRASKFHPAHWKNKYTQVSYWAPRGWGANQIMA